MKHIVTVLISCTLFTSSIHTMSPGKVGPLAKIPRTNSAPSHMDSQAHNNQPRLLINATYIETEEESSAEERATVAKVPCSANRIVLRRTIQTLLQTAMHYQGDIRDAITPLVAHISYLAWFAGTTLQTDGITLLTSCIHNIGDILSYLTECDLHNQAAAESLSNAIEHTIALHKDLTAQGRAISLRTSELIGIAESLTLFLHSHMAMCLERQRPDEEPQQPPALTDQQSLREELET